MGSVVARDIIEALEDQERRIEELEAELEFATTCDGPTMRYVVGAAKRLCDEGWGRHNENQGWIGTANMAQLFPAIVALREALQEVDEWTA